jgi:RNA polymerase sigma-70 factor (ECF subfamily)
VSQEAASTHREDLALARACAEGDEHSWERFVREYRPVLHRAADAMAPGGGAREIADELFAELYGLREREGERQSLFQYFHGRSSLSTWLRAVLAQRFVDRIRASRRTESLPAEDSIAVGDPRLGSRLGAANPEEPRCRAAVREALDAALAGLEPRDRLRLRCYYTQELKLAAIGKLLGEHEATASRQLARVRRDLRQAVETRMREGHGYAGAGLTDCLQLVMSDAGDLDLGTLLARTPGEIVQNERQSS